MLYSYSRLKTYDCPKRFFLKYVLEKKEPSGEAAFLGKIVHGAIEGIINGRDNNEKDAVQNSLKIVQEEERENGFKPPEINISEAIALTRNAKAKKHMGKAEEHFELPLDPNSLSSPMLQGYIDLYNNASNNIYDVVLTDWKTNRSPYHPLDNHQLGLYAWALSRLTGAEKVLGILRFVRYKETKEAHLYTAKDMETARKWALDRANIIELKLAQLEAGEDPGKLFPENPESGLCMYCSFTQGCSGGNAELPGEIKTYEDAVKVGARAMQLKAELDRLQDMLKNYCKKTGNSVLVGSQEFTKTEYTRWSFSSKAKKEMAEAMLENDINPWEIFNLGSSDIKKLKKYGWNEDALEAFGRKRTSESFRWVKTQSQGGSRDADTDNREKSKKAS
jgi:hypothetical protein